MNNTVVITIGCSGSGKSYTYDKHFSDYVLVCPDDIRKQLTGNISDQSKNHQVWTIAYSKLSSAVRDNKNVYFSATNCKFNTIKELVKAVRDISSSTKVILLTLKDSYNKNLCLERVKKDIDNNVDRSNTLVLDEKEGITIVEKQQKNFINLQRFFASSEFQKYKILNNISMMTL